MTLKTRWLIDWSNGRSIDWLCIVFNLLIIWQNDCLTGWFMNDWLTEWMANEKLMTWRDVTNVEWIIGWNVDIMIDVLPEWMRELSHWMSVLLIGQRLTDRRTRANSGFLSLPLHQHFNGSHFTFPYNTSFSTAVLKDVLSLYGNVRGPSPSSSKHATLMDYLIRLTS